MFGKKPEPAAAEPLPQAPDARETALRHAALKQAVEAHRGAMPTVIVQAAENYYQFLKGKANVAP